MKINSVLGEIDSGSLGFTLSHEHFMMVDNAMRFSFSDWVDIPKIIEQSVFEAKLAMEAGVNTIVDATPINLGRDVSLLREIASRTGLNIIVSTGFYYQERPWFKAAEFDVERLTDILTREAERGISDTEIKPGIIKCATEAEGLTPVNIKLLQTAARLHKRTGLPIMTHASVSNYAGLSQQEVFKMEGVDLINVVIGHCDDSNDVGYIEQLLKNGSYVGMDRIGVEFLNKIENRVNMIVQLCRRGWAHRILLSHDCNVFSDCGRVAGQRGIKKGDMQWNFRIVANKVLPMLRSEGITEDQIKMMTVSNPRNYFEGR